MSHRWEPEPEGKTQCGRCGAYRREVDDTDEPCLGMSDRENRVYLMGMELGQDSTNDLLVVFSAGYRYAKKGKTLG